MRPSVIALSCGGLAGHRRSGHHRTALYRGPFYAAAGRRATKRRPPRRRPGGPADSSNASLGRSRSRALRAALCGGRGLRKESPRAYLGWGLLGDVLGICLDSPNVAVGVALGHTLPGNPIDESARSCP